MGYAEKAKEFLQTGQKFRLGDLTTEKPHPLTENLSQMSVHELPRAIESLKTVDLKALELIMPCVTKIKSLQRAIQQCLNSGGRIFLCGCGATGRLSLALESLWRKQHPGSEQVKAFMAGGDIALVHAIEGFEDFPEYGAKQLDALGFGQNDLLISCTEGGETPFVIGATWRATEISKRKPFFLFCNLVETLMKKVERSKKVLESDKIESICLFVGPMALTGSTRMQASTALQLAVGLSLFSTDSQILKRFQQLFEFYKNLNVQFLEQFIRCESEIYAQDNFIHYLTDEYAITVFTDTTERAPTFSLRPFSPLVQGFVPSLAFVSVDKTQNSLDAWQEILQRKPHCLEWFSQKNLSQEYLTSFDFCFSSIAQRSGLLRKDTDKENFVFKISETPKGIELKLKQYSHQLEMLELPALEKHLILKMLMNIHSTLVMGRYGRYKSNIMTWVYPTNGKLIDRAARFTQYLLQQKAKNVHYEDVVLELHKNMQDMKPDVSVVLKTYEAFF